MERKTGEKNSLEYKIHVPNKYDLDHAIQLSALILESGSMLPKSVDELLLMFDQGKSVVLTGSNGELLAHGAITFVFEEQKMLEIGAIIVGRNFRGKGLGKIVTSEVIALADNRFPGYIKIALCNENSLPMFLKMGAIEVKYDDLDVDPGVFLSECVNCPRYKDAVGRGKQCCDTLVIVS